MALALLLGALLAGIGTPAASTASATPNGSVAPQQLPPELAAAATATAELATLAPGQSKRRIHFQFKKNHKNPTNSRLILYGVTYTPDRPPRSVKLGEWRAGSGIGGTGEGQDACASDKGWLPNGRYDGYSKGRSGVYHSNYDGGLIFGIVWHLEDKRCRRDRTERTELFIHSEMTPGRRQACKTPYRENQCWDGPTDYVSAGCIKLKPKDIKAAAQLAKTWGGPQPGQTHYPNLLLVTN